MKYMDEREGRGGSKLTTPEKTSLKYTQIY